MISIVIGGDDPDPAEIRSVKEDHRFNRIASGLLLGLFGFTFFLSLFPAFYYMNGIILVIGSVFLACSLLVLKIALLTISPEGADKGRVWKVNWKWFAGALIALWASTYYGLPLKLGFLTIHSKLERIVAQTEARSTNILSADIDSPLYRISAKWTNERSRDGLNPTKILFVFANDWESAFVYSPGGIANLAYNSGSAGHLFGNWYWMKED
jgi:hypothetical protein